MGLAPGADPPQVVGLRHRFIRPGDKRSQQNRKTGQVTGKFVRSLDKRSGIRSDTRAMASGRAGSLESLRRLNRLRVIHALRDQGLISRAEIARRTGLSRSTVSSLVSDLQADGLVVERAEPGAAHGDAGRAAADPALVRRVGRRRRRHRLRPQPPARRGLRPLVDGSSPSARCRSTPTTPREEGLDAAAELVGRAAGRGRRSTPRQVIGAGMGLPGPIRQEDGVVGSRAILPGWVGVPAADEMRRRLDIPILVDNDANLGALAEAAFGAARDASDLVYLKVASGIGAGLILNGRLYRGSARAGGRARPRARRPGGRSCAAAATAAAWRRSRRPARCVELLRRSHGEDVTVARMLELARAGDLGCRRVIADAGRAIGQAVVDRCSTCSTPSCSWSAATWPRPGDLLLDGVRESIARAALPVGRRGGRRRGRRARRARTGAGRDRARGLRGRSRVPDSPRGRGDMTYPNPKSGGGTIHAEVRHGRSRR